MYGSILGNEMVVVTRQRKGNRKQGRRCGQRNGGNLSQRRISARLESHPKASADGVLPVLLTLRPNLPSFTLAIAAKRESRLKA
jgi:hypothetical protein